jgi:hypothetical protein
MLMSKRTVKIVLVIINLALVVLLIHLSVGRSS